jgi:hypothetical protein
VTREQNIRAVLFYLSVAVFFIGLPFILTFTLGYKLDRSVWKFVRTGLISLKTQPAGASVFLNGVPRNDKTPCSINELLPGTYTVDLKLAEHYPYSTRVEVRQSTVTRLEKILLFPLRPDVQKLNKEQMSVFWVDEDKQIYYVGADAKTIYRSDPDGDHSEKLVECAALASGARQWKVSPDRKRILYFNDTQIGVSGCEPEQNRAAPFVLDLSAAGAISDVFWYTDSYNIIVIAGAEICMLETRAQARPFVLMKLNSVPRKVFYESDKEILYFQDAQAGADNKAYENVYKLELKRKLYPFGDFSDLMGIKKNERAGQTPER